MLAAAGANFGLVIACNMPRILAEDQAPTAINKRSVTAMAIATMLPMVPALARIRTLARTTQGAAIGVANVIVSQVLDRTRDKPELASINSHGYSRS